MTAISLPCRRQQNPPIQALPRPRRCTRRMHRDPDIGGADRHVPSAVVPSGESSSTKMIFPKGVSARVRARWRQSWDGHWPVRYRWGRTIVISGPASGVADTSVFKALSFIESVIKLQRLCQIVTAVAKRQHRLGSDTLEARDHSRPRR